MEADGPLLADLGNRRLKLLLGNQLHAFEWAQDRDRAALEAVLHDHPQARLVLTSSSPAGWEALQPLFEGRAVHRVRPDDVRLERATTGTGTDRLLVASAAYARSRGAVLVADCGTAFTVDLVDQGGVFRGGAIGPGLAASRAALAEACPHLQAPAGEGGGEVPASTAAATRAGTVMALAAAVDGLAARWQDNASLGARTPARWLTGGDAAAVHEFLPGWTMEPRLLFEGLALVAAATA